jgi:hypothetical protein
VTEQHMAMVFITHDLSIVAHICIASLAKAALPARTSAPKVAVFEGIPRGRQLMLNGPVDVCIPRLGTDARPLRRRGAFTHATTVPHLAMPNEPSDLGAVKPQALSAREYPSGGA